MIEPSATTTADAKGDFVRTGVSHLGVAVDAGRARALHRKVLSLHDWGASLFMPEAEFRQDPQFRGVNPRPGCNLAETLAGELGFIEDNAALTRSLCDLIGHDYRIRDRKFVCGVPAAWLPAWLAAMVDQTGVKNLGAYVQPEFRDMTYFSGIDFHQDIIDWPDGPADFITLYVYLDEVGPQDAPLHLLPHSHELGATCFPHALDWLGGHAWRYQDDTGHSLDLHHRVLTGPAGDVNLWHPFILHGTQPVAQTRPRISLRYLLESRDPDCPLMQMNRRLRGVARLAATRSDLDDQGRPLAQGNLINRLDHRD